MSVTLRNYQSQAVEALIKVKKGIVKSPAGSGKTWIAAATLQRYAESAVRPIKAAWVANTLEQCNQARAALALFPSDNLTVDVFCYAAMPFIGSHDIALADECQHCPAECFRKIFEGYTGITWGVSATPEREDDLRDDVFTLLGPIVFEVERKSLIAAGTLCQGVVRFLKPNEEDEFVDVVQQVADGLIAERKRKWPFLFSGSRSAHEQTRRCVWQAVVQEAIYNNPKRDAAIVGTALQHCADSTLIIVGSVDYGNRLAAQIPGAEVCYAKIGKKKRADMMSRFSSGELKTLIATSLAEEGLDVPRANVIILTSAGKSSRKAEQTTGRVLRTFDQKTHGIVYDFNDVQHGYLQSQVAKRLAVYQDLDYVIETVDCPPAVVPKNNLNESENTLSKGYIPTESLMATTTTPLQHADREHSRHSPSSLENILKCSGFLNDQSGDKTFADRGTLGHEAVEKENPDLCGNDESLRKAVEICIKYLRKLANGADQWIKEKRVKILDQSGSFDHLIIKGKEAWLCDLKMAWNSYFADGMQAKAYAVGVFDAYPEIKTLHSHFILPFLGEVSVETFERAKDYDQLVAEVRAVIERARKADPEHFRINKMCGYCARAGVCPKLTALSVKLASRYDGEEYVLPEGDFSVHGSDFTDPAIAAALLKLAGPVEKCAESWRRGAMRLRMEEGIEVPGFKLVIAKGKRSITNAPAAYEAIKDIVTPDEFIKASSVQIGKLEDIFASKAPKGKKAAYVAELADRLTDANAVSEGSAVPKLVPDKGK